MRESPGGFAKILSVFSDFIILERNELLFLHVISHVTKEKYACTGARVKFNRL